VTTYTLKQYQGPTNIGNPWLPTDLKCSLSGHFFLIARRLRAVDLSECAIYLVSRTDLIHMLRGYTFLLKIDSNLRPV